MSTYVSLVNWTEQGIKNFPDTIRRADEFTRFVQGYGGKVREVLWTVGEYNVVHSSPSSPTMRRHLRPFSGSGRPVTSDPARCGPSPPQRWTPSST